MRSPGRFFALTLAPILAVGGLAGCATYKKCGFRGCPGDARITAEVQALLDQNPPLGPPNEVYVQTLDHVVYLNGVVDTPFQLRLAESLAGEAAGVSRVVNNIGLSSSR
jgi:osmotically-inducible protein OsmY